MTRLVAFLRGINLGNRRLTMDELRRHVAELDVSDVATFIASGNVVFDTDDADTHAWEGRLERHLAGALGFETDTFVRSLEDLVALAERDDLARAVVDGFVPQVMFLKTPVDDDVLPAFAPLETPDDRFLAFDREVVWLRRGRMSDSPLRPRDLEKALGGRTNTMRNLNTVRRLVGKFGG